MKTMLYGTVSILAILLCAGVGCRQTVDLKYKYKVGDTDKIRYSSVRSYKNWIEMEDKKPQGTSLRKITENLILQREILSVETDGTAVMKVTVEQADVEFLLDTADVGKSQLHYHSTPEGTDTTWGGLPPMAGVTYTLKIAPDTTIREIQGLEGVPEKYFSGADQTFVGILLEETAIRRVHQRDFLQSAPDRIKPGQTYDRVVEIPDSMVKAEAVKRMFTVDSIQKEKTGTVVSIRSVSEPLLTRPEGFPPPPQPRDFGALLKETSDMQEFKYDGKDVFDASRSCALKEEIKTYCYLIMMEETFFMGMEKYGKTPEELSVPNTNAMLTEVTFDSTYEKLE